MESIVLTTRLKHFVNCLGMILRSRDSCATWLPELWLTL